MPIQHLKRQSSPAAPQGSGISGLITATSGSPTDSILAFTSSNSSFPTAAPGLNNGVPVVVTVNASSTALPSQISSSPSPSATASHNSSSKFSLAAVIGICVGVFVAAALIIGISVYLYRRSSRRGHNYRGGSGSAGRVDRNTTWSRLADDRDVWEAAPQTQEVKSVGLKHAPSVLQKLPRRSLLIREFGSKVSSTDDLPTTSVSAYNLANQPDQPHRPFAKQSEDSMGDLTVASANDESFLSLRSVRIEPGTMSPGITAVKITPAATTSLVHHWESAEVFLPDQGVMPELRVTEDPFADTHQGARGRSLSNPFFGAQQRRPSLGRKSLDKNTRVDRSLLDEGTVEPVPPVLHKQNDSIASNDSSASSTDRAMQSLIAALDLPQEEIERRLRVASMRPSEISSYSVASNNSLYE